MYQNPYRKEEIDANWTEEVIHQLDVLRGEESQRRAGFSITNTMIEIDYRRSNVRAQELNNYDMGLIAN
jgi:hypothetical protein